MKILGYILWTYFYFGLASMIVNGRTNFDKSAGIFLFGAMTILTTVSLLKPNTESGVRECNCDCHMMIGNPNQPEHCSICEEEKKG